MIFSLLLLKYYYHYDSSMAPYLSHILIKGGRCLKIEKRGDVYEWNIVNVVVVECDVIYVSILYHLYRICKAGQFAGIYSPLVKSIYILKVHNGGAARRIF